jgi:hypothetical protein
MGAVVYVTLSINYGFNKQLNELTCVLMLMASSPALEILELNRTALILYVTRGPPCCRFAERMENFLNLLWEETSWIWRKSSRYLEQIQSVGPCNACLEAAISYLASEVLGCLEYSEHHQ